MTKRGLWPQRTVNAIIDDWAPYYVRRVDEAMNGSWSSTDTWGGSIRVWLHLAPYGKAVPDDVKAMAEEAHKAIPKGGCMHSRTSNKMVTWLKAGELLTMERCLVWTSMLKESRVPYRNICDYSAK